MKRILTASRVLALTLIYTSALLLVSLIRISPDTLSIELDNADKVFHFFAHFGLTILWQITYILSNKNTNCKPKIWICLIIAIFGIVIEFLQGTLTSYRSFDWFDVLVNVSGVLLAYVVLVGMSSFKKVKSL